MSTFDQVDLFDSGPHRFHIGGLSLRHVLNEVPGGRGVRLSALGQHGRAITQTGDLVADHPSQIQALMDAIEAKLDGQIRTLVDDIGRSWPNTVMLSFDPKPMVRVGPRVRISYTIQYLQVVP